MMLPLPDGPVGLNSEKRAPQNGVICTPAFSAMIEFSTTTVGEVHANPPTPPDADVLRMTVLNSNVTVGESAWMRTPPNGAFAEPLFEITELRITSELLPFV